MIDGSRRVGEFVWSKKIPKAEINSDLGGKLVEQFGYLSELALAFPRSWEGNVINDVLVLAKVPRYSQFFIGVLIVLLGAITTCFRWFESRRSETRTGYQRWITLCTVAMLLLTVLGLVLRRKEVKTNEALSARNDAKAKLQNNKIRVLENIVAKGARKAEAADREIIKAKKLVAEANERAQAALRENEENRAARLATEDRSRPRRLISQQGEEFVSCMKPFSGSSMEVDSLVSGGDETNDLASDFRAGITRAGIGISNSDLMVGVYFRGIKLRIGRDRVAQAHVIARFLVEHQLSTKPVPAYFNENNPQELAIVIGSKP